MAERIWGIPLPRLAEWRGRRLLTQAELAASAGVTVVTVKRAERGGNVSYVNVRKFAAALGVSPDDLRQPLPSGDSLTG